MTLTPFIILTILLWIILFLMANFVAENPKWDDKTGSAGLAMAIVLLFAVCVLCSGSVLSQLFS